MPSVIVLGGGLAGLASAVALASEGYSVRLLEARPFLGGRATSYEVPSASGAETIDNCQHILLRCCVNLLDLYRRLGVEDRIRFYNEFTFIEPGGRQSVFKAGRLPAPAHFAGSFLRLRFLDLKDKLAIARAMGAILIEHGTRRDLHRITMLDWLREKQQTPKAIERFWRQILVSAVNEELDRMAAAHGFQVIRLGFLAGENSYEMGVPAVPLGELYSAKAWGRSGDIDIMFRTPVTRVLFEKGVVRSVVSGEQDWRTDFCICALPSERIPTALPELALDVTPFEPVPITGIHLWFDRPITDLPHATLLDRTIQWMFNKEGGRYIQLVVSASRSLSDKSRAEVISLAARELSEYFPVVREARLEKAHVVKEMRATFSAKPGLEELRPKSVTPFANLFLAGDWTRSGWPATMEGAVRSGYMAAEAVTAAAGKPVRFLLPDIA